jgi:hypothetical protein
MAMMHGGRSLLNVTMLSRRSRRRWRVWQRFMDPTRFVFLDETGTATK